DVLVVDLPPGTGDVALTLAQKVPVSGAVVVSTPQNLALLDAKKAIDMFDRVSVPVMGVIENMAYFTPEGAEKPISLFPKGDLDSFLDAKKIPKLSKIPFKPSIGLSSEAGIPSVAADPNCEEAQKFLEAAQAIQMQLNEWT